MCLGQLLDIPQPLLLLGIFLDLSLPPKGYAIDTLPLLSPEILAMT